MDGLLTTLHAVDWLECAGLAAGLLCVWLLIRQNVWTWPVGIVYVCISLWVFLQAKLYADLGLHLVFLALNCYGWWFWLHGGSRSEDMVPVTTTDLRTLVVLVAVAMAAALASGAWFERHTDAALPYWDNTTTMLSLAAMWLSTRKKLENWILWFVVDVLATGIYFHKGLYFYTVLYLVYIGMAVMGWRAWRRAMESPAAVAA
ncbi:MAG: nicotinamide riboside transporter PnuC [Pseudomonadales bacterium]|jgi:nicotinamide mononucleotide transporter|nr:nicotinamide riboside transporter PnuC [Pseudomonadales bacterium]